jgi:predicted transcriptional regulator
MGAMAADHIVAVRVSSDVKARLRAIAVEEQVPESAIVQRALRAALYGGASAPSEASRPALVRLAIRLRADDRPLLAERAAGRNLAPATYVSAVVRAHLRNLAPLPKEELLALRRAIAELSACGRNLNQIAHAAHRGQPAGYAHATALSLLKACEALRDHVRGLLKANLASWESGYDDRP